MEITFHGAGYQMEIISEDVVFLEDVTGSRYNVEIILEDADLLEGADL